MDIVTGYQGKEHVKADQLRRLISGMAGDGTYVLETQNKLAATMVTANQVRIDTGDLIAAGGAYATVETPETLTIESGATGQKRIDLVVARYEKDASTSVESMELNVVKGAPVSYGDPAAPEVAEGSIADGDSPVEIPLYSILIDGLAPGTPEQLFESAGTIDSLRDSVSHDTGWVTLWQSSDNQIVAYRMTGRTACVRWNVLRETSDYWECSASLPEDARPERDIYSAAVVVSQSYFALNTCAMAYIGASGEFGVQAAAAQSGAHVCGTASWLV